MTRTKLHTMLIGLCAAGAGLGCGARTGLPDCASAGVYCPTVNRTDTFIKCSCSCSAPFVGTYGPVDVPVCLQAPLNFRLDSPSQLSMLNGMSDTEVAMAEALFCQVDVKNTIETIAHQQVDACGIGGCTCDIEAPGTGSMDLPACDTPCGTVACSSSNCSNVLGSNNTINIDNCLCNQASSCGNTSETICRPPPGTADPPILTSGLMTGFLAALSTVSVDPSSSKVTATVSFSDDLDIGHSDTESSNLSGNASLYGEPRADGTADLVLDMGLYGTDATFSFSGVDIVDNVNIPVKGIRITGGTGTSTLHVDSTGVGMIPAGTLSVRAGANVNGSQIYADSTNASPISLTVDFAAKTFTIPSFTVNIGGQKGTTTISGTITNQPPRAVAPATTTVECTSPTGAPATLDGTASFDPDGNMSAVAWHAGGAVDQTNVIANALTTTVTAPFTPPSLSSQYSLVVTDSDFQTNFATETVTVADTTPPALTASVAPTCIWPPDHKMALFGLGNGLTVHVTDTCDTAPTFKIVSVTSNQPVLGGGSGSTAPDVLFGDHAFCVRSEREGTVSTPRVYTVVIEAKDASGNKTSQTVTVEVGHDQGGDKCAKVPSTRVVADDDPRCTAN